MIRWLSSPEAIADGIHLHLRQVQVSKPAIRKSTLVSGGLDTPLKKYSGLLDHQFSDDIYF